VEIKRHHYRSMRKIVDVLSGWASGKGEGHGDLKAQSLMS